MQTVGVRRVCFRHGAQLVLPHPVTPPQLATQVAEPANHRSACPAWLKPYFHAASRYWMPDVFDNFFASFGRKTSEFLTLKRLDPPYRLFLADGRPLDVPDKIPEVEALFERLQPGGRSRFREFMAQAKYKYQVSMADYVQRPSLHLLEFFDLRMLREAFRLHMFQSQAAHVRSFFTHPDLVTIMEWPVLFLGGAPKNIPAMYSMMNYAAIELGTWFPMGGMGMVPLAMKKLALSLGVEFCLGDEHAATRIAVDASGHATGVETKSGALWADYIVGAADYHHIEADLLDGKSRNMSEAQWDSFVMSPSSLLFFLGVSRRLSNLRHHNLFFDEDLDKHATEIYEKPRWPSRPLFYACLQSLSDPSCAPQVPPVRSFLFV
jgi:phytoene desaturase